MPHNFNFIRLAFVFVVVSGCAFNSPKQVSPKAGPGLSAKPMKVPNRRVSGDAPGPIDDCLMHSALYSKMNNLSAECTMNYVHYFPKEPVKTVNSARVRIGSYNLFHLGDKQAPMKNLSLIAAIINRWDVAGVQELMPLPLEWSTSNQLVFSLMTVGMNSKIQFPYENWEVVKPGYLNVLLELQKLDSSWALILQSQPEGEGSTGEMAGFFYRSRSVSLKEWTYCDADSSVDLKTKVRARNLGCLLKVPDSQKSLISRTAFAAYFKSGNFDFVGLTAHVRFSRDRSVSNIKAQKAYVCAGHEDPAKCSIALDETGRFYEIKVIADQISEFEKASGDKDIIYMADTNLEINSKTAPIWSATLSQAPGFEVFQPELTTLSVPGNKLASNYDHFILNRGPSKECDIGSIRSYNYWQESTVAESKDEVVAQINSYMNEEGRKKMLAAAEEQFAKLVKVQSSKQSQAVRPLTAREMAALKSSCSRAIARMRKNRTGALMELLSDHLPIEMNCSTKQPDDD